MTKNPNKKAGNWGALKNKPQNLVPFNKGGTTKQTDMKKQLTKKQAGGITPNGRKPKIATVRDPYNYETKGITKNKINALGRGVTKTKATDYFVPGKFATINDTDSPEMVSAKTNYLNDKRDQQKTGTQKTRTVTNLNKGTVKTVTKSKGSYVKDGEKKRVVTKSMIPGKSNSGAMKTGGSVKKYQAGGPSYMDQVKGVTKRIAKTPAKTAYLKDLINITDAKRGSFSPKTFSSGVYRGVTDINNIKDTARVIAKKSQHDAKFKRARVPSDVIGEKPKYLKKAGGSIKKKK
jgi:hypothetical protein